MIASHQVKPLQLWSGRIGHAFLVLASMITAYAGWIWGDGNIVKSFVFASFMGLCPWAVAYLLPFVSVAKSANRFGNAAMIMFVVFVAGAMEWRAEMMVFAGQRNTSAVGATMQQARYEDARNAVSDLEKQFKAAQAKLEEQIPYGPSASYASQIKDAEDLATRESSKERRGCQKRCDDAKKLAADLRAKQAIALDREQNTQPNVDRLTKDLADARIKASNTKAGDSMSVAEAEVLSAFFTGSLEPGRTAMKWTDMLLGAFMAFFLLVVPTQLIYNSKIDWQAKQAIRRLGLIARLKAWLNGEKIKDDAIASDPSYRDSSPVERPQGLEPSLIIENAPVPQKPRRLSIQTATVADLLKAA